MTRQKRTCSLQRRGFRDRRDLERLHARARVVAVLLAEAGVDHVLHTREAGTCLVSKGAVLLVEARVDLVLQLEGEWAHLCNTRNAAGGAAPPPK